MLIGSVGERLDERILCDKLGMDLIDCDRR